MEKALLKLKHIATQNYFLSSVPTTSIQNTLLIPTLLLLVQKMPQNEYILLEIITA